VDYLTMYQVLFVTNLPTGRASAPHAEGVGEKEFKT
jgi:hypothetical protein